LLDLIFLSLENQKFTQLDKNILGLENLSLWQELSYFKFLFEHNYSFLTFIKFQLSVTFSFIFIICLKTALIVFSVYFRRRTKERISVKKHQNYNSI